MSYDISCNRGNPWSTNFPLPPKEFDKGFWSTILLEEGED